MARHRGQTRSSSQVLPGCRHINPINMSPPNRHSNARRILIGSASIWSLAPYNKDGRGGGDITEWYKKEDGR